MAKITLYRGSPDETLVPTYGKGEEKHDCGRGFCLTPDIELAREWAVCNDTEGYLYQIDLDVTDLEPPIWISWILISTTRRHGSRN